ncbi:MAG: DUF2062 domain-containing protein [Steroidobacteraceae bacterium]
MSLHLFKKLSRQRHHLSTRWYMKPFAFVFGDAAYWSINRRNVTRAVALGFFIAFLPPPIPHTLVALAAAIALRVNIPVTMAAIFITNPITMVPLFYAAYWSGCYVLGLEPLTRLPKFTAHHWLPAFQGPFLEPFLLGCLILGLAVSVVAYILLGLSWHLSLVYKLYKRKQLRRHKENQRDS